MSQNKLISAYMNNLFLINFLERSNTQLKLLTIRSKRRAALYRKLYILNNTCRVNRRVWTKVQNSQYWENDVPKMYEEDFKNAFRVNRSTFKFLVDNLKNMERMDTTWRLAISLAKKIAISLYALGSSAEYRTIASLFGVGRTTVGEVLLEFCTELYNIFQKEFLNTYPPTQEKINEIVRGFELLGFPQCFGAIDGCHIEVSPPKDEAVDYYNYKGWYSTVLFAAVDYRYRFTYINVGSPGRCNDSTIFENSLLKIQHEKNPIFVNNSKKIEGVDVPVLVLGDSAFKLSKSVMKPFPFSVCRDINEQTFNYQLSKCRRVVENAFGHLKARFRRVGKGLEVHIDNAPIIIKACCVLHNICNNKNDNINKIWLNEAKQLEKRNQPNFTTIAGHTGVGNIIRNALKKYFGRVEFDGLAAEDGPAAEVFSPENYGTSDDDTGVEQSAHDSVVEASL